jgi:hypothetical protein
VEFALFLAVLFVLLWAVTKWSRQIKAFARAHPVVLLGNLFVAGYAFIRAFAISHIDTILGFTLGEPRFLWTLEIAGLLLICAGAIRPVPKENRV